MSDALSQNKEQRATRTIKALEDNGIAGHYVATATEAADLVKGMLEPGEKIAAGGSATIRDLGLLEHFKSGRFDFIDRAAGETPDERHELQRQALLADTYFASVNAITEQGELYIVDKNGNRAAAIMFGPKRVVLVVSMDKLVYKLEDAIHRVKSVAAPTNCVRLECKTFCSTNGQCVSLSRGSDYMTAGCASRDRICCDYVVMAKQAVKDRITVVLVGDSIGF